MTKTQEKSTTETAQLDQAGVLIIRLYARLKRVEKFLKDKLEKAKERVLGLAPLPEAIGDKVTFTQGEAKIASIARQDGRTGIDAEKLKTEFPDAYAACLTRGESFLVIRIH